MGGIMSDIDKFCCVRCGSENLCYGHLGSTPNVFIPSGIFTIHGFKTRSYVCVDCGYLGTYISRNRLEKLREKLKDRLDEI